ncbi:Asp-tRNA(Asn)/Glu-tRNA(Gln) amidotransferase subunit GatC [bacterium]|jgi:aspartyl-tRNA(Asn)/glutamyl-tRNA(Gln) amidotransferase subunit C|nr:Asp-tRNA(Asn)/Glu-tRNA(Gln) amidotransferase subunit GatC [bacterium]
MSISESDLDRVLKLSHLHIPDSEKADYVAQLDKVLGHMDNINQLNLDDLEPSAWANATATPARKDVVVKAELDLETNAPEWVDHSFRVPSILGKET